MVDILKAMIGRETHRYSCTLMVNSDELIEIGQAISSKLFLSKFTTFGYRVIAIERVAQKSRLLDQILLLLLIL